MPDGGVTGLVISQVFGGNGATVGRDYVELFNSGTTAVSLAGLSVQYGAAAGVFGAPFGDGGILAQALPNVVVPPGGYFLVAFAAAADGGPFPMPDVEGVLNLSGTNGKVALASGTEPLGCGSADAGCTGARILDAVGYGTSSYALGDAAVPALSSSTAAVRKANGCQNTRVNAADFDVTTPNPRNSAAPLNVCVATDAGDAGDGGDADSGDADADADGN
jgi:hypothetical protein